MADYPLSEEDKDLFRQTIKRLDGRVLDPKEAYSIDNSEKKQLKNRPNRLLNKMTESQITSSVPNKERIYLSDYYVEPVQSETILSYCQQQFSYKRFQTLKKGEIPWERKLDLHGQYPEVAKQSLIEFIDKQTFQGARCLLVVHGKGGMRNSAPVLKNLVNHWLPQFANVLAFHSAIPRHGGTGAVYVLLKK